MNRKYRQLLTTLADGPVTAQALPDTLRDELGWAEWNGHVRYNGVTREYRLTDAVVAALKRGKVFHRRPQRGARVSRWLS